MTTTPKPGERVAFSAVFLRSIGSPSGWRADARGVLVRIDSGLAQVVWDGSGEFTRSTVNVMNLVREEDIAAEAREAEKIVGTSIGHGAKPYRKFE